MNAPIIIGGCPSSGTTLVRAILDTHSRIACGPELGLFDRFFIYREPFIHFRMLIEMTEQLSETAFFVKGNDQKKIDLLPLVLDASSPFPAATQFRPGENVHLRHYIDSWHSLSQLAVGCESYEEFFDQFFGLTMTKAHKSRWAEKTPENVYFFPECLKQFPNYQTLQLIRDPYDTIASLINRHFHPIEEDLAIRRYIESIKVLQRCAGHSRYFVLRYEDLVRHPKGTVKRMMRYLDEDLEGGQMQFYKKARAGTADYAKGPIFESSVGRGQKELSAESLKRITEQLNREVPFITEYYKLIQPPRESRSFFGWLKKRPNENAAKIHIDSLPPES